MASFSITGSSATAQTLSSGESGIVNSGATLNVSGAIPVTAIGAGWELTVNGLIITISTTGLLVTGNAAGSWQLTVGAGGSFFVGGTAIQASGTQAAGIINIAGSIITAGSGARGLVLGDGNDAINMRPGADISGVVGASGGGGIDSLSYVSYTAAVTVDLTTGAASGFESSLTGVTGFENVTGSNFDDVLGGSAGANTLDGGAGINTVSYASASASVTVSLSLQGSAQDTGGAGSDRLDNFDNLTGSRFADTLTGDGEDNLIRGGAGNDTLSGGLGQDTLDGGAGADSLSGGGGIDLASFHLECP